MMSSIVVMTSSSVVITSSRFVLTSCSLYVMFQRVIDKHSVNQSAPVAKFLSLNFCII